MFIVLLQKADARKDALEEKRCESLRRDEMRVGYERMEKARLRGKHALEKELLTEVDRTQFNMPLLLINSCFVIAVACCRITITFWAS